VTIRETRLRQRAVGYSSIELPDPYQADMPLVRIFNFSWHFFSLENTTNLVEIKPAPADSCFGIFEGEMK
jgi:hypothetical protein